MTPDHDRPGHRLDRAVALRCGSGATPRCNWPLALLTLALIFVYSLILAPKVPVLLAVPDPARGAVTSYVVALILTLVGVFEETRPR
jgi:hypothetical protein